MFDDNDSKAHDTLLSNLKEQGLRAAPGELSEYCNDGFTLLEILVERVSGISFTELIAKYFSEPLGIENTKTSFDNFDRERLVKTYMPIYDGALPPDSTNILGTGGLYASAEDMCKFAEVVMGKKPEILSEKSALAMQNEEYKKGMWVDDNGEIFFGYGFGWDTVHGFPFQDYGIKVLAKGGDTLLYHSILVVIPEYNMAMAVASSGGVSLFNYSFAVNILQERLKEKGIIERISPLRTFDPPVKSEMPKELEKYSGTYVTADSQKTIEIKEGALTLSALVGGLIPKQEYIYTDDNTFKSADGSVELKFAEQKDGNTYLQVKAFLTLSEVEQFIYAAYDCQKITPETISDNMLAVWQNRAGKNYYVISEKHTSQFYFLGGDIVQMKLNDNFTNGFVYGGSKIIDENHAVNTLKFRDVTNINFYTQDGVEYLKARDFVYIGEDNIPEIWSGKTSTCTIQTNGFARYYKIGENAQGREMNANIPENASYAVYDENGTCVNFTTVSKNNTTILPANGKIVFIGNVGDIFEIRLR